MADGAIFVVDMNESVIVDKARVGDIVSIGGLKNVRLGDTLAHMQVMTCLRPLVFDEPRFSMAFGVNDSPLARQDGKKVRNNFLLCFHGFNLYK